MLLLRIATSVALLGLLLWLVDIPTLNQALANVAPWAIAAATLAIGFTVVPFAIRWRLMSRVNQVPLSFRDALVATTNSYFFNQVLISTLGGDAYRVLFLSRRHQALSQAVSCVLTDRLVGLLGLLILVMLGQPILMWYSNSGAVQAYAAALGIALLAGLLALRYFPIPKRLAAWQWSAPAATALTLLREKEHRPMVVRGLTLAVLGQLLLCLAVWLLAQGLQLQISLLLVMFLFPPAYFISLIPVTIGGWGTREGAMVTTMTLLGVPAAQSLALSVLFGLCMLLIGLLGGISFAIARRDPVITERPS